MFYNAKKSKYGMTLAAVLLAGAAAGAHEALASSLTVTTINSPFPANLAYPGFPTYTQADLTTLGSLDWIRVGEDPPTQFISKNGFNQKSGGAVISNYAGTSVEQADNDGFHDLSYDDPASGAASAPTFDELLATGGFSFQAAATNGQFRELDIFAGVQASSLDGVTGTLTATLFNAAGAQIGSPQTATLSATAGNSNAAVFQIDYLGNSATDHLAISFNRTAGANATDFVSFSGAAVSAVPAPLPPAAWSGLSLLAVGGLLSIARKKTIRAV